MALNLDPLPCRYAPRCTREVFPVRLMKEHGAPVDELLDARPGSWAEGARIKLLPSEHLPRGQQLAKVLTAAGVRQAFAAVLYVPHAEVCEAQQRRRVTGRKDGHA